MAPTVVGEKGGIRFVTRSGQPGLFLALLVALVLIAPSPDHARAANPDVLQPLGAPWWIGWDTTGVGSGIACDADRLTCTLELAAVRAAGGSVSLRRTVNTDIWMSPSFISLGFRTKESSVWTKTEADFSTSGGDTYQFVLTADNGTQALAVIANGETLTAARVDPGIWYSAFIELDPTDGTVAGEIRSDGAILTSSGRLAAPNPTGSIQSIVVQQMTTSGYELPIRATPVEIGSPTVAPATTSFPPQNVWGISGPHRGDAGVRWSPPGVNGGNPVTGYRVYASWVISDSGLRLIAELPPGARNFSEAGLPDNTSRYYKLTAMNSVGESPLSEGGSVRTYHLPEAPRRPNVTRDPDGIANFTWIDPSDWGGDAVPVVEFRVYRIDPSGSDTYLGSTPVQSRSYFRDVSATVGITNCYQASMVNEIGEGPRTPQRCIS